MLHSLTRARRSTHSDDNIIILALHSVQHRDQYSTDSQSRSHGRLMIGGSVSEGVYGIRSIKTPCVLTMVVLGADLRDSDQRHQTIDVEGKEIEL